VALGELIQALCLAGEGFHRGTIQRGSIYPLARFGLALVHANISPCSHVSDLTKGRATISYTILIGRVMDVGQFIPLSSPIFAAWQGWTFLYPRWRKQRRTLDFSYFQRFCSVATRPRRRHQPQPEPEPELEPEATPTIDMRLQALEAKLDHLQLLEPKMQALYRLGMANADMLSAIC